MESRDVFLDELRLTWQEHQKMQSRRCEALNKQKDIVQQPKSVHVYKDQNLKREHFKLLQNKPNRVIIRALRRSGFSALLTR